MNKTQKIALVSDAPPDPGYTGGQVLDKIIQHTPFAKFEFFWINQSNLPESKDGALRCEVIERISYKPCSARQRLRDFFSKKPRLVYLSYARVEGFFVALKSFFIGLRLGFKLRKSNYDLVWLVLQGENLAMAFFGLSLVNNKKTILQQWDPISWWMNHGSPNRWATKIVESIIFQIEKKAWINLVPSEAWKQLQESKGLKSHRIDNFFCSDEIKRAPLQLTKAPSEIHAIFLGQLYANKELDLLIEKLIQSANALEKNVVLHYFGNPSVQLKNPSIKFVNHGFVSRSELIESISNWDIALLPYPMEERFDDASKYSFPSKSRVYIAAGLPILSFCHGNSSPQIFYSKYYNEFYRNALLDVNISDFIEHSCTATLEKRKERALSAQRLIDIAFSYEAELKPLHELIRS